MRCAIVAAVVFYGALVSMAVPGTVGGGSVHNNAGRYEGVWSDVGLLFTLIVAAPAVVLWAIGAWRRLGPKKEGR